MTVGTNAALVSDATIEVRGVSKWFGNKVAVSDVTCSFGPGITGLLGPNGAGKTTLLRMMMGLTAPSQGSVSMFGEDPRRAPTVFKDVAFVPEDDAVYPFLTARQFVRYAANLTDGELGESAVTEALRRVEMLEPADRLISDYSKGMRQRAKVAAALVHNPRVLVLDEPLNGTDPVRRASLIDLFKELAASGHTIIISSHVLQEVERLATRVIAMVDGKLAAAGDIHAIRAAMSDIPYQVRIDTDTPRQVAAALLSLDTVSGIDVLERGLRIETTDLSSVGNALPRIATDLDARVTRFEPVDESLESVFRYLVKASR
ncbi:Efflux ABC transporter, ATP-binding protein [hydrothermal vent metagenome]|uniref:Efflux ABC transporter, ATP-binding protein n=1 Tax=hydrothermal vent metagenome TaxID=652676 RepID=A0A3B0S1Q8_9ZZZZ